MSGYRISLNKLSFTPTGTDSPVLSDVTFHVEPGDFVAIVGLNGSGKTTLLRTVAGLVQASHSAQEITGKVTVGGREIDGPISKALPGVGIVNQFDHYDLIPHLSIIQNIAIRQLLNSGGFRVNVVSRKWRGGIAHRLGQLALGNDINVERTVSALPGGLRQMLAVAVAVDLEHREPSDCRLLLLDEHTSKLDHKNAPWVMRYTAQHIRDRGITTLMVTHKYEDAKEFADKIVVMSRGRASEPINASNFSSAKDISALAEGIDSTRC